MRREVLRPLDQSTFELGLLQKIDAPVEAAPVATLAPEADEADSDDLGIDIDATVDEFEIAGLEKLESRLVKPWRVKGAPVHFECRYHQTVRLPGNGAMGSVDIVFGLMVPEELCAEKRRKASLAEQGKLVRS